MSQDYLFDSVEHALTFAFNYTSQQSPQTPMSGLMRGGAIGSGKGLHGVDGAAQAAMILNALDRLPKEQRWALTVRFGDVARPCPCCGHDTQTDEWIEAADNLAWCDLLDGIPKQVRREMVAKVLCRRKVDLGEMAKRYKLVRPTLYRQQAAFKDRLNQYERKGLDALRDELRQREVIESICD